MTAVSDPSKPYAYPLYTHRPKGDLQTLVYGVVIAAVFHMAWITVTTEWLRDEASPNDLKALAIMQIMEIEK